jgi:hypothetical protein
MEKQFKTVEPSTKLEQQERDLSPEEKVSRILQLSPSGRKKYKEVKDLTGDVEGYRRMGELLGLGEEKATDKVSPEDINRANRTIAANQLFGVSPEKTFEQVSNIIYPKVSKTIENPYSQVIVYSNGRTEERPTEGLNPAYKPTWRESEIPGSLHKDKTGRYVQEVGLYDPNADLWNKDAKGRLHVARTKGIKVTSTETNGEKLFSKEIKQHFNNYKKSINGILKSFENNINPETGIEFSPEEKSVYLKKLEDLSSNYSQEIKNTAPPSFSNWYKQLWESSGGGKKAKTNPDKATYWNELMKAYRKGNLSSKALESGYNLYLSTYLTNPFAEHKLNEDYTTDIEENETTNDDEE